MANKIQIRRDTTANWTAVDPVLSQGELGLDIVLKQFKIGDGQTVWSALDFFVGVQGPQGPAGIDGIPGAPGEQGPAGADGVNISPNELTNGSHTVSLNPTGLVSFPVVNESQLQIEGSEIIGVEGSPIALSAFSSVVINTYNPDLHSWQFTNNGTLTLPYNSTIEAVDAITLRSGFFVNLATLEEIYTNAVITLRDAFSLNETDPNYPWGLSQPLGHQTFDEISNVPPESFENQIYVAALAHDANVAYLEWQAKIVETHIAISVSDKAWAFNATGTISVPTLTVDLHNGGLQSGQVLQFNDKNKQVIITGPTPDYDANAERIIIQGQRGSGNGEGGDVYVWGGDADVNGGDIKIYAGDGNAAPSSGGYVHISGGSGYAYGGNVTINAGNASQYGGNVAISSGYAGNGTHGKITLNSGPYQWDFAENGVLTLPTSQFNTAQVFTQGGIDLLIGSSTHFWEFKDNQTIVFPDYTVQSTAYQHVAPPTHAYGALGNKAGMIAFDSSYMYYCTANFVATSVDVTVNNIRGPAQNAAYSSNGGGYGTMIGFDGVVNGLASGQKFTYNSVQYTVQDVSNTANPYAYIIFTPQMDAPTTAGVTAGTVLTVGSPQPDIWKRIAYTPGTW